VIMCPNLDTDIKKNITVMNYIHKLAKQDILSAIVCLSAIGKIYQAQYIQPEQVTLFTGSKDKIIAEHFTDLDLIAPDKIDNKLFLNLLKKWANKILLQQHE